MTTTRVPRRIIEARIRRVLARQGEVLGREHGAASREERGDYFIVDYRGQLRRRGLNVEQLARELGILQPGAIVEG